MVKNCRALKYFSKCVLRAELLNSPFKFLKHQDPEMGWAQGISGEVVKFNEMLGSRLGFAFFFFFNFS